MNKLRVLTTAALVLCFVSLGWLLYDLLAFTYLSARLPEWRGVGTQAEVLGILVGVGLLFLFLYHIFSLVAIIMQLHHERSARFIRAMALLTGSISLLLLFSDFAMMQDIYKESKLGWDTGGEWTILYINHAIHLMFLLLSFRLHSDYRKKLKARNGGELVLRDEKLFLTAQYIGVACGVLGLTALALGYGYEIPRGALVTISAVILAPYVLIVCCWLIAKWKEKSDEWYDEKQFRDIAKASFFTLLVLLPCMALVYAIENIGVSKNITPLWFIGYVFLTLGIFSGGTLYFSTRG